MFRFETVIRVMGGNARPWNNSSSSSKSPGLEPLISVDLSLQPLALGLQIGLVKYYDTRNPFTATLKYEVETLAFNPKSIC